MSNVDQEHATPAYHPRSVIARAPGRVCLLGEHTDYNDGLALAMAIEQGVSVRARRSEPAREGSECIRAYAADLDEHDEFPLANPGSPGADTDADSESGRVRGGQGRGWQVRGWRAFVRGIVAELARADLRPVGAELRIEGDVPRGAGLSSSAALEVSLALALLELAGTRERIGLTELARLCSRVENEWAGARTGLLDQLSSLYGRAGEAMLIDFQSLAVQPTPLRLDGWRLVTLDTGERRENANSGYNQRRRECAQTCELLGVRSLREVDERRIDRARESGELPQSLYRRAKHVLGDNRRVGEAVAALRAEDLPTLARLLNESHKSLRENMEISTPTVDATVARMLREGAAGARLLGGGFGGSVLGLLPASVAVPAGACEVRPCAGARVQETEVTPEVGPSVDESRAERG